MPKLKNEKYNPKTTPSDHLIRKTNHFECPDVLMMSEGYFVVLCSLYDIVEGSINNVFLPICIQGPQKCIWQWYESVHCKNAA